MEEERRPLREPKDMDLTPLACILGDERHGRPKTIARSTDMLEVEGLPEIHASFWSVPSLPDGSVPHSLVLFCHGYGHYMDSLFDRLASELAVHGFACAGFDLPGSGRSEGTRGLLPSVEQCSSIVQHVQSQAIKRAGHHMPCFLYGESFGAAVAIKAAMARPGAFAGLILMWPLTGVDSPPNYAVRALLSCVASCMPSLSVRTSTGPGPEVFADPSKREHVSEAACGVCGTVMAIIAGPS
jgi:alpha-beta hydrolase superfamily lysophospholipase